MGKRVFALMMVMVGGILVLGNLPGTSAQCGGNFTAIFEDCGEFFRVDGPTEPSKKCCYELLRADPRCACPYIAEIFGISPGKGFDLNRIVSVMRTCGIRLTPGAECGYFTIPPASQG